LICGTPTTKYITMRITTIGVPRSTIPAALTTRLRGPSPYTSTAPAGKPTTNPRSIDAAVSPIVNRAPTPR